MRNLVKKLKNFLHKKGYELSVQNKAWVLEYEDGVKIHYDSICNILDTVWKIYNEDLENLDFNILSNPAEFEKRFAMLPDPNEIRSQLLEEYLDCASFYMLANTDDRLLQFCMTDHYQITFNTSNGMKDAWGFYEPYMMALENCTCIEHGIDNIRYRLNWFAGISEPGDKWDDWFQTHQTITYKDANGLMHNSEIWAPRIGNRSIDSDKYLEELECTGSVEIDLSNFYENFKDGMKFFKCLMLIRKF